MWSFILHIFEYLEIVCPLMCFSILLGILFMILNNSYNDNIILTIIFFITYDTVKNQNFMKNAIICIFSLYNLYGNYCHDVKWLMMVLLAPDMYD